MPIYRLEFRTRTDLVDDKWEDGVDEFESPSDEEAASAAVLKMSELKEERRADSWRTGKQYVSDPELLRKIDVKWE